MKLVSQFLRHTNMLICGYAVCRRTDRSYDHA